MYGKHLILLAGICLYLLPPPLLLAQEVSFPGGQGRGDFSRRSGEVSLSGSNQLVDFPGGGGRGDAAVISNILSLSGQAGISYPGGSGSGHSTLGITLVSLDGLNQLLLYPGGSGGGSSFRQTSLIDLSGVVSNNLSFPGGLGRGDAIQQTQGLLLTGQVPTLFYPGGIADGTDLRQSLVLLLNGSEYTPSYPGGSGRGNILVKTSTLTLNGVLSPGFARTAVSDIRDFRLIPVRNRTRLFWQTAGGARTDYYRVEQSRDGHDFSPVGFVSGSSNLHSGAASSHYSFPVQPGNGTAWFRLLQVFADSSFAYSPVLQSSGNMDDTPGIQLWPNPVEGRCRLIPRKEGDVDRIRLFDASGKALGEIPAPPSPGGFDLDLAHLVPGLYWLEVEQGNESSRIRFVRP